ncbi:hypothetical protein AHAS_Ahas13G0320000 [Arachis hypogaea]
MHLVSCDKLCLSKKKEGLGFRSARMVNNANLIKLAWKLVQDRDSLCVIVMHNKYGYGTDPISIMKKQIFCSNAWKGIFPKCHRNLKEI